MIIYPPNEYPAPLHYHALIYSTEGSLSVSARYHTVERGEDQYTHLDQLIDPVLRHQNGGALLIDVWTDDIERDWVASTAFFITGDDLALREARTFGQWRDRGLVCLMTSVAQNLTGWGKQVSGHRWVDVW